MASASSYYDTTRMPPPTRRKSSSNRNRNIAAALGALAGLGATGAAAYGIHRRRKRGGSRRIVPAVWPLPPQYRRGGRQPRDRYGRFVSRRRRRGGFLGRLKKIIRPAAQMGLAATGPVGAAAIGASHLARI